VIPTEPICYPRTKSLYDHNHLRFIFLKMNGRSISRIQFTMRLNTFRGSSPESDVSNNTATPRILRSRERAILASLCLIRDRSESLRILSFSRFAQVNYSIVCPIFGILDFQACLIGFGFDTDGGLGFLVGNLWKI